MTDYKIWQNVTLYQITSAFLTSSYYTHKVNITCQRSRTWRFLCSLNASCFFFSFFFKCIYLSFFLHLVYELYHSILYSMNILHFKVKTTQNRCFIFCNLYFNTQLILTYKVIVCTRHLLRKLHTFCEKNYLKNEQNNCGHLSLPPYISR